MHNFNFKIIIDSNIKYRIHNHQGTIPSSLFITVRTINAHILDFLTKTIKVQCHHSNLSLYIKLLIIFQVRVP